MPLPARTTPAAPAKKLIEVALPLDAINAAAAREKSIRHGHPSTLHLWWARRPLAAARAVLFSQMVDDPESSLEFVAKRLKLDTDAKKRAWVESERRRLFKIIEDLVVWENTTNETVLEAARTEIRKSWQRQQEQFGVNSNLPLPAFHDPFAGGGALPLEAQRLGLESFASDLNPVAVLINKAMLEIPPRFSGRTPVNPKFRVESLEFEVNPMFSNSKLQTSNSCFTGAKGLAADVRYYGNWMREEAKKRIGKLYPTVRDEHGKERTVIAWLWARTVASPNPALRGVPVPLCSTFVLSSKKGKEVFVEPVIAADGKSFEFTVKRGTPPAGAENGTKMPGKGANFRCILSGAAITGDYIKAEGCAGRMGARLMAIVCEGERGRIYFPPPPLPGNAENQEEIKIFKPEQKLFGKARDQLPLYGYETFGDLFTQRQLAALTCFSDLVGEAREQVRRDALASPQFSVEEQFGVESLEFGENAGSATAGADKKNSKVQTPNSKLIKAAEDYANAVAVYLAFAVDRLAMTGNNLCRWNGVGEKAQHCFGRQALPMIWDFAEVNFFARSKKQKEDNAGPTGSIDAAVFYAADVITWFPAAGTGNAQQADAQTQTISANKVISTDPPYYDNIGYADLSDFFYVWLRRSLAPVFPDLFGTLVVPKKEELVATPYRHGSKDAAEKFFLNGMTAAMANLAKQAHPAFPVTIYYAFKQSETGTDGTSNTGWATFLEAVIQAGFQITGTWPMRTEMKTRQISMQTNALASSIVLVCRKRAAGAGVCSRRDFVRELNATLPAALAAMTGGGGGELKVESLELGVGKPFGVESLEFGKGAAGTGGTTADNSKLSTSNSKLQTTNSPIAPVDLAQAIIGPGMAVFSKYAEVLEADGSRMSVASALRLINRAIGAGGDDFDADTLFCLDWFGLHGWNEGAYGEADVLARARGTSVEGLVLAGVVKSAGGKTALIHWKDYPADYDPRTDTRTPAWEALHHLARTLEHDGSAAAGRLAAAFPEKLDDARALAYRLYTLCERKGWAELARVYNDVGVGWDGIENATATARTSSPAPVPAQQELPGFNFNTTGA
jgi:putative DNA methylase